MDIKILYEDKDVIAVDKPAGLLVHSDGKSGEKLLTDWILENYPKIKKVGEHPERPGIIHRLDRETSGVMIIAKTKKSFEHLKKQFQDREINKKYLAFVYGEIKDRFGIIDRPIGRSPKDFRRWSATRGARGEKREAITWYSLLVYRAGFSFLEIEPKTGRTHQIRVHFKAINHPIVSDALYAGEKPRELGFHRTALHARSITFRNTLDKKITATAQIPADFVNAIEEMGIAEVAKNEGLC